MEWNLKSNKNTFRLKEPISALLSAEQHMNLFAVESSSLRRIFFNDESRV